MDRPTSLIAYTVRVFATAHKAPARRAQTVRCDFFRMSRRTYAVPFRTMGTVQRATKTPATMPSEITKGENALAAKSQKTPSLCNDRGGKVAWTLML